MFFFLLLYLKWPALSTQKLSPSQELSPPQRPLCVVGRLGRKKQKARGASSTTRSLFFYYCYFYWYPPGGDATPSGFIYLYFALLLARVASVSVLLRSKEQGTRVSPTGTLATHAMPLALWIVSGGVTFVCKHTHVNHHQNAPSSSDDKEEPTARRNG